jgi:HTH-like domain/Integrase core domain
MTFRLIEQEKAHHAVSQLCRVLGVSRAGFYAWTRRPASQRARQDATLTEQIRTIHQRSRATYGAPRIHAELRLDHGVQVGRKRVARLMRAAGLVGCHRRRRRRGLTRRDPQAAPASDLLNRDFTAQRPDQVWTADITYIPTWAGWLYLAVVLDVFSRRVVGWAMADHLRTELVLDALDMAIWNRRPQPGLVHHSDQGASTPRWRSAVGCVRPAWSPPWARSVTALTMRSPRASSPRWSASCWTATASAAAPRHAWPSSTTWRASTTPADGIRPSATSARPTTRGAIKPATLQPSPDLSTEPGQLHPRTSTSDTTTWTTMRVGDRGLAATGSWSFITATLV